MKEIEDNMIRRLMEYLSYGKENAQSRYELALKLKIDPRTVRKLVNEARKKKYQIVSYSSQSGYWLPDYAADGENDWKHYLKEIASSRDELNQLIIAAQESMTAGEA